MAGAPGGPQDLVRLAHYPFLPEVRQAVREEGPSLAELLGDPGFEASRTRALERVQGSLAGNIAPPELLGRREALLELLSVAVARMLVAEVGEKPLVARYAAAEARLAAAHLAHDLDSLDAALAVLQVPAERAGPGQWRMHFSDYLRLAPKEPEWKLVTRAVAAGHVGLGDLEMVRLAQEALRDRIAAELDAEAGKPTPPETEAVLLPLVERLEPALDEARKAWSSGDFGPVQPGLFPPCVKAIFDELRQGRNVPHHGRFAFATFLHTIGWNADQILDYLSATPNFDREKSRYQIEHVTGQKGVESYMVPNCSTMQTNGVCPLANRDGVCARIKNPLGYYRVRLRLQRRDEAQAAGQGGAAATGPAGPSEAGDAAAPAEGAPAPRATGTATTPATRPAESTNAPGDASASMAAAGAAPPPASHRPVT